MSSRGCLPITPYSIPRHHRGTRGAWACSMQFGQSSLLCSTLRADGMPGSESSQEVERSRRICIFQGPVHLKIHHGGTEEIGSSDHRIIWPLEQPFVFRSPDHPIT